MVLSHSNPYSGLVGVILVLVVIGLVVGLVLSDSEFLNPTDHITSDKDDPVNEQYERKAEQDRLDLRLLVELIFEQRKQNQDLLLRRVAFYTLLSGSLLALLSVSIGLTIFLIRYEHRPVVKNAIAHTWRDPAWRAEQIRLARQNELDRRDILRPHQMVGQSHHSSLQGEAV